MVNASLCSFASTYLYHIWENAQVSTFEERCFQMLYYYDTIIGWHTT